VWRYVGLLQLKQYAGQIYGTSVSAITAVFCARCGGSCSGVAEINWGLLGCDFSKDRTAFVVGVKQSKKSSRIAWWSVIKMTETQRLLPSVTVLTRM
jgi:hypothetical protein